MYEILLFFTDDNKTLGLVEYAAALPIRFSQLFLRHRLFKTGFPFNDAYHIQ